MLSLKFLAPVACRARRRAVLLAWAVEISYCVATAGLGVLMSLALRWRSGQTLGERVAGIQLVKETTQAV